MMLCSSGISSCHSSLSCRHSICSAGNCQGVLMSLLLFLVTSWYICVVMSCASKNSIIRVMEMFGEFSADLSCDLQSHRTSFHTPSPADYNHTAHHSTFVRCWCAPNAWWMSLHDITTVRSNWWACWTHNSCRPDKWRWSAGWNIPFRVEVDAVIHAL